jgi:uncharacterized membrane protein YccC
VLSTRLRSAFAIGAWHPDYAAGLRAATATVVPLAVGDLTGRPLLLWMALGGWLATLVDPGGPYPLRASAMLAFAVAASVGVFLGGLVGANSFLAVALLLVWATACALARFYGDEAATVGSLALIAFAICMGTSTGDLVDAAERAGLMGAGALWAAFLALALWPLRPYRPVRKAVAATQRALAANARALVKGPPALPQRAAARAALETARRVLADVRGARQAETARGELLGTVYEAAELALGDLAALAESLQSSAERGAPPPPWLPAALEEVALAFESAARGVEEDSPPPPLAFEVAMTEGEIAQLLRRLRGHAQLAWDAAAALQGGDAVRGPAVTELAAPPRPSIRAALSPASLELRNALRVGVTAAAALAAGQALHLPRKHWIVVTAVLVLQTHSGATTRKALQRILGTVVGALVATALAPLVHTPLRIAAALFVMAVTGVALRQFNHAVYIALITPLFILMAESTSGDWHLTGARIADTLLGGVFALFGSMALWPHRERERLPGQIAALLLKVRDFLQASVSGTPQAALAARRESGLAHANADAAFDRFLDEPHTAEEAEALMALLSHSRRLVGAIAGMSAAGLITPEQAVAAKAALEALATAAAERRTPPPLPDLSQAERLQRPLEVIHSALTRLARQS